MCKKLCRGALATSFVALTFLVASTIMPKEAKASIVPDGETSNNVDYVFDGPGLDDTPSVAYSRQDDVNQPSNFMLNEHHEYYRGMYQGQVDFSPTRDAGQIVSCRQGNQGNCVSMACIKAGIDAYTKKGVFAQVEEVTTGYRVTLQDGRIVDLSFTELQFASSNSGFAELGFGDDISFANFAFAVMAKNMQALIGLPSFESAVFSLNNGQQPLNGARWIGLSHRVVHLTGRDISAWDSIVAYGMDPDLSLTSGHCVFVDNIGHGKHARDMYGKAVFYGPELRHIRVGRFGLRTRLETRLKYENRFAFAKASVQPPATTVFSVNMVCGSGQEPRLIFDHNNYEDALEAAVRTGRPLVIKGGATWCGPCQQQKRIFSSQSIKELLDENAVFVEVEADRQHESVQARRRAAQILRDLNVKRYPTVIVVSVSKMDDGRYFFTELGRKTGMMGVNFLDSFLKNAFKRAR